MGSGRQRKEAGTRASRAWEERLTRGARWQAGESGRAGLGSGERTGPGGGGTAGWAGSGWTRERLGRAGLGRGKGWAGLRFSFFWVFFLFPILFYS